MLAYLQLLGPVVFALTPNSIRLGPSPLKREMPCSSSELDQCFSMGDPKSKGTTDENHTNGGYSKRLGGQLVGQGDTGRKQDWKGPQWEKVEILS